MSEERIRVFREIVIVVVLSLVLVSALGVKAVYASSGQVTLRPTDDTFADSSNPGSNYGGLGYLQVMNYQSAYSSDTMIIWLRFDLSSIPEGAVIDGATLSLYASLVGETYTVQACSSSNNSWTELSLTNGNMPNYNTTSMDSVLVASANQWYNWTVVDAVENALSGNPKSVTIVMQEPNPHSSAAWLWFDSKESQVYPSLGIDYRPELTIHWSSVVPEFPTFLVLPFFMMATLIGVTLYKKKSHASQKRARNSH
jgi:hypothetical protein